MKNSLPLLFICAILLFTSSCKKKEQFCKLGKYYSTDGSNTPAPNTFFYYDDDRLQKIIYSNHYKDSVTYSADTIIIHSFDDRDSLVSVLRGILNGSGYLETGVKTGYDYTGNVTTIDNYSLQHNADGNVTQKSVSNSSGTTTNTYEYAGGNRSIGKLYVGSVLQKKFVYFHSTVLNKSGIDDDLGVYNPYFGKPSRNLLDSMYIIEATDTARVRFTHQLDVNGYVLKTVRTYLAPVGVDTRFFTYSYFDCAE
jgi:hypothetical protein